MTRRHGCVRGHRRLCLALVGVLCAGRVSVARAQGTAATIDVRVASARVGSGAADAPVPVQLQSVTDPSQSWSAQLGSGASVRFRRVPPGRYRLISGTVERPLDVASGDALTVDITRAAPPAAPAPDMRVTGTHRTAYGTRFDSAALERLPQSGGVYGLIERSDPLVITERIEGGGAYPEPQRLGASGASWTQTSFRLGDADLTDPDRTGVAMLYPNLDTLQGVSVTTAGLPPDEYGGGTSVMLVPRAPASTWERTIEFAGSPAAFQSVNPLPAATSIARLRAAAGGSFVVSGPVTDRLGILLAGALARSTRLERDRRALLESRARTLSAHLAYKATTRDDLRLFAQTDRLSFPVAGRATLVDPGLVQQSRATLLSTTWNRTGRVGLAWSANATYAGASSAPALSGLPIVGTMERLRDGPVYELASSSSSRRRRTSVSWRGDPGPVRWRGSRHRPEFGASASWTGVTRNAPGASLIGELVDGRPARAWQYTTDGTPSRWSGLELAFWATNEIPVTSRVDIDLGLRASTTAASRDGVAAHLSWRALSPSVSSTWHVLPDDRLTLLVGVARYAARLPLTYLSFGDPHGLTGSVHRWNDVNRDLRLQADEVGMTLAAVGPCCANGRLNAIASDLQAPRTTETRASLQTRLTDHLVLRLAGTDRRTSRLIQPVNAAYTLENFSLTHVEDTGLNLLGPGDDQLLPIFNRLPASFGTDSYVLQNVGQNSARDHGLDVVLERPFDGRWGMLIGATAHKSGGIGGNRGFRPDENDQGVLGEVFSEPNAATFAPGRLFFERGYVVKWSAIYRLPYGLRGGTAARYQDGQHFARVVIAPDVQQGVDFIPALPRGLTRFTYTFTLDTRLEKTLRTGAGRASVILEVFNLLNTNNEVEEYEVTGPAFRASTAVQPPRSVRLRVRFTF
jgi:hypothetical protein